MTKDIESFSEKEYRAYERESFSSIKYILESPKSFLYYKEKPFQGSTSSLLGTCIHHFIQGNRHLVAFSNLSKIKKNAEAIKEFEDNFRQTSGEDGIIVPASFEPKINSIMKNVNENSKVSKLLDKCEFEKAFLFEIDGVKLKGKVDGISKDYLLEIKSSSQATNALEFKEEAYDRNYDMQAYMYLRGSGIRDHYFIVVNTLEPFKVAIYKSSKEFLLSGEKKTKEAMRRYKKYILNKEVWDDSNEIEEI